MRDFYYFLKLIMYLKIFIKKRNDVNYFDHKIYEYLKLIVTNFVIRSNIGVFLKEILYIFF